LMFSENLFLATLYSSCIGSRLLAILACDLQPNLWTNLRSFSRSLDHHLFEYGDGLAFGTHLLTVSLIALVRSQKAVWNWSAIVISAGGGMLSSRIDSSSLTSFHVAWR
jgi:hypothetical protein